MHKQLQIVGEVRRMLEMALGATFDFSKIAVFETIAIDNQPVNAGGLFHKAVIEPQMLAEMEDQLAGEMFVPLQTLHPGPNQLPVGRVVTGKVHKDNDTVQLRTLFYLPTDTEEGRELIAKINGGVITDVSIGVNPKKALCSDCGFDYMGPDSDIMNLWLGECDEGHVIGVDGTHLRLTKLDKFFELSLVSNGAADAAVIQNPDQSIYQRDHGYTRLAASAEGKSLSMTATRHTNPSQETIMKLNKAQLTSLRTKLTAKAAAANLGSDEKVLALLAQLNVDELTADAAAEIKATFQEVVDAPKDPEPAADPAVVDPAADPAPADPVDPAADPAVTDPVDPAADPEDKTIETSVPMDAYVELAADKKLLERQVAALTAENAELKSKAAPVEGLQASVTAATAYLSEACRVALVAAGETKPEVPQDITALVTTLTAAQAKLKGKLPVGGVALSATTGVETKDGNAPENTGKLKAFTTRKQ